jgi:amino acid transporter
MLLFMFGVLISFIVLATRYLVARHGMGGLLSVQPSYDRATLSASDVASATSFAALTYLGFDAVTTLAEDVKNPRRNVLLAAVSVCLFTGVFGGLLVYLAHLAWPDYTTYANVETAFIDVTGRADQANGITFIEKWRDKKAFDEHCAMPYISNFFDNVRPGLVDRFEVKLYEEILP